MSNMWTLSLLRESWRRPGCLISRLLSCSTLCILCQVLFAHPLLAQTGTWSDPTVLNDRWYYPDWPSMALSRDGKIHVVWESKDGSPFASKAQVYLASYDGAKWSPAVAITDTGKMDYTPDIAVDTLGNLHLVWGEYSSGEVFYRWFNGSAWSTPLNISQIAGGSYFPRIAIDHRNWIHVVWHEEAASGDVAIYYRMFNGTGWSNSEKISDTLYKAAYPNLSIDTRNVLHVTFHSATAPHWYNDIFYRRFEGGAWSEITRITSDTLESHLPSICVRHNGAPVIVWSQRLDDVPAWPPDIRICLSEFDGGGWTPPAPISDSSEADSPTVILDARDDLYVVWEQYHRSSRYQSILFSCRVGGNWGVSENVMGSASSLSSGRPIIKVDSSGIQHVIWLAADNGVYYTRHDALVGLPREREVLVGAIRLEQNYPNPFNGQTNISYSLPARQRVSIRIFDLLGRTVETMDLGEQQAGRHSASFSARGLASGVYLYRLQGLNHSTTRKMYILR